MAVPGFNRGNLFYEFYELSGQLLRPAPVILRRSPSRLILEIDIGERLSVVVACTSVSRSEYKESWITVLPLVSRSLLDADRGSRSNAD